MRQFGFSTGSLAKGDFRKALDMMEGFGLGAIELSALREDEWFPLLEAFHTLELTRFQHVSLHAPSRLSLLSEEQLCESFHRFETGVPVVVHPDIISNWQSWAELGERVLIENMDKRKPIGRTADELSDVFSRLPNARLCLDLGHSRQIDTSMLETRKILRVHGERLAEIHLSDVNSFCGHERLCKAAIESFQDVAELIPDSIPIILETPVQVCELETELARAREIFVEQLIPV